MKWIIRLLLIVIVAAGGFLAVMLVPGYLVPFPEPQAAAPAKPATPDAWRVAAESDLAAIKKLLEDHTPIPFDTQNPDHGRWLKEGYDKARALAAEARDEHGYFFAQSFYVNGFQDPHIAFNLAEDRPDPMWPGFIAASKGENAVVVHRDAGDPDAPALGTVITACDGMSLDQFARERILPFTGNAKLAISARNTIARIFLDRHNPFAARARSCTVETPDGPKPLELNWREVPKETAANEAWFATLRDAVFGPPAEWGISELAPGVTWIGVPTFSGDQETVPKLKDLIAAVQDKASAMRQGRAIVIDTRGNGGGSTHWSERLTAAIFPADVVAALGNASGKAAADWRASEGNARYWRQIAQDFGKDFGPVSLETLSAIYTAGALWARKDDALPIWRSPFDDAPGPTGGLTSKRPKAGQPPFPAQVYVLSNGSCGSTCLNFADQVLMVPGVKLIGSATSGDSAYMEVRQQRLPSGLARLTIPQKVWRGMGRGNLEAYSPDIPYEGQWDNESVRAWVLGLVESKSASASPCAKHRVRARDDEDVCRLPPIGMAADRQERTAQIAAKPPQGSSNAFLILSILIRALDWAASPAR